MPIATLTCDFSDPDEQQEHLFALKGKDSRLCISELDEKLRRILKYPMEGQDDVGSFQLDERTIRWVRRCLYEIVEDRIDRVGHLRGYPQEIYPAASASVIPTFCSMLSRRGARISSTFATGDSGESGV